MKTLQVWNKLIKKKTAACLNRSIRFGKLVVKLKPHESSLWEIKSPSLKKKHLVAQFKHSSDAITECARHVHTLFVIEKPPGTRGHTLMGTAWREHFVLRWLQNGWSGQCATAYDMFMVRLLDPETCLNKRACEQTKRLHPFAIN